MEGVKNINGERIDDYSMEMQTEKWLKIKELNLIKSFEKGNYDKPVKDLNQSIKQDSFSS